VEVLLTRARARFTEEQFLADEAMFVTPKCSPSPKDMGGPGLDLDKALDDWLASSTQVLLLHGHSGSGKSLYVVCHRAHCVVGLCDVVRVCHCVRMPP
jgi:hypothetical protein